MHVQGKHCGRHSLLARMLRINHAVGKESGHQKDQEIRPFTFSSIPSHSIKHTGTLVRGQGNPERQIICLVGVKDSKGRQPCHSDNGVDRTDCCGDVAAARRPGMIGLEEAFMPFRSLPP